MIHNICSMCDFRVIILPEPKVTQCRPPNLFCKKILLGLFHSKKNIVTNENLYLFLNLKHKHLMISFTVKGIQIRAFRQLLIVVNSNMSPLAMRTHAPTF